MDYLQRQFKGRRSRVFLGAILGGLLILVLGPAAVRALTISPPVIEIEAAPGSTIKEKIKIINTSEEPQIFYLTKGDFAAGGEGGEPVILEPGQVPEDYPYSLTKWLSFSDEQIFLPAWEKAEIAVTLKVPEEASPGGHYGAVFFESRPPQITGDVGVGVVSKIGTLILVRVSGKATEQGRIVDFETKALKHRFSSRPIEFFTRFENSGNVHLKPHGKIDVYNMAGRAVASLEVNEKGGNVLPGSIRRFEAGWPSRKAVEVSGGVMKRFWLEIKREWTGFGLGKYTGYLSLDWGGGGKESNATVEFWLFPWRLMTTVVLGLGLVLLILTMGVKRYNSWILARSASPRSRN